MKPFELAAMLTDQAAEIAREGHNGWGNTMTDAARMLTDQAAEVERLTAELDEERDRHDRARAEVDVLLPPNPQFYMDPPDGGGVDRVEVVRRYIEHLRADLAAARAERDGLAKALATTKDAVCAAHDFLLRERREDNPEKGIVVDKGALPTWNLLCDAIDALAALPPKEDGRE